MNLCARSPFSCLSSGFVHCLNERYPSALAIILFLAIGSATSHQALATSEVGLQDRLLEFERRGVVADFEIEKVPNRGADEVDRIMGVLDKVMAKEAPRIFEEHYQEVERSIQDVSIQENFSAFKVYLESRKEALGIDETVLDTLVRNFMSQTETSIEPLHGRVSEIIDAKVSDALASEMTEARSSIREPFQYLILNHFPDWPGSRLPRAVLAVIFRTGRPDIQGCFSTSQYPRRRREYCYLHGEGEDKEGNCRKSCRESCNRGNWHGNWPAGDSCHRSPQSLMKFGMSSKRRKILSRCYARSSCAPTWRSFLWTVSGDRYRTKTEALPACVSRKKSAEIWIGGLSSVVKRPKNRMLSLVSSPCLHPFVNTLRKQHGWTRRLLTPRSSLILIWWGVCSL